MTNRLAYLDYSILKENYLKLARLGLISCLTVGAGLISMLAVECHIETINARDLLLSERNSIIADPRSGASVYSWMYLHSVEIPTRWHYVSYATSCSLLFLAAWLMLRTREQE